jgi:hypothetical protein
MAQVHTRHRIDDVHRVVAGVRDHKEVGGGGWAQEGKEPRVPLLVLIRKRAVATDGARQCPATPSQHIGCKFATGGGVACTRGEHMQGVVIVV